MTATPIPRAGAMRASDEDRHEAVTSLSEHYAQGRLDLEEFTTRMESAQRATYREDLAPLFADLPQPRRSVASPPHRYAGRRGWLPYAVVAMAVLSVLAVAHGHVPWLLIPFAWFLAVRVRHVGRGAPWHRAQPTAASRGGQTTP